MELLMPGDPNLIELRGDLEREFVDVLDALAKATRRSRTEVWLAAVKEFCKHEVHKAKTEVWLAAVKEFCKHEVHKANLVVRLSRRDGNERD